VLRASKNFFYQILRTTCQHRLVRLDHSPDTSMLFFTSTYHFRLYFFILEFQYPLCHQLARLRTC